MGPGLCRLLLRGEVAGQAFQLLQSLRVVHEGGVGCPSQGAAAEIGVRSLSRGTVCQEGSDTTDVLQIQDRFVLFMLGVLWECSVLGLEAAF